MGKHVGMKETYDTLNSFELFDINRKELRQGLKLATN